MKLREALNILTTYHAWRIGDDEVHMQKPSEVTKAIETLLNYHIVDVNKMGETATNCNMSEIPTSHTKTEQMTSIEWLIDQMFKQGYLDGNKPLSITNLDHLQQQAVKIHKEEIKNAWDSRNQDVIKSDGKTAEHYYQKTFKID
jgi:hypothetical protein